MKERRKLLLKAIPLLLALTGALGLSPALAGENPAPPECNEVLAGLKQMDGAIQERRRQLQEKVAEDRRILGELREIPLPSLGGYFDVARVALGPGATGAGADDPYLRSLWALRSDLTRLIIHTDENHPEELKRYIHARELVSGMSAIRIEWNALTSSMSAEQSVVRELRERLQLDRSACRHRRESGLDKYLADTSAASAAQGDGTPAASGAR